MSSSRYREMEKACREVAERISLKADRAVLLKMAEHWGKLAEQAEAQEEAGNAGESR